MSELEVSEPTHEDMVAELKDLRADRVVGAQLLDAARARADQDNAELREVTADRERWKAAASDLRSELWRQVDGLRAESAQQHEQITQLSLSLGALLEAIVGTTPSAEAIETATGLAAGEPAAVADAAVETAPEPVALAPYVPANEPKHAHLQPKPETPEFVPNHDQDRVGLLTELMAVADNSGQESAATGTVADRAAPEESVPNAPNEMTILPTAEPVAAKRRRMPRLSN